MIALHEETDMVKTDYILRIMENDSRCLEQLNQSEMSCKEQDGTYVLTKEAPNQARVFL